jgi:hypothetical protein
VTHIHVLSISTRMLDTSNRLRSLLLHNSHITTRYHCQNRIINVHVVSYEVKLGLSPEGKNIGVRKERDKENIWIEKITY